jgi:hypothetical protein
MLLVLRRSAAPHALAVAPRDVASVRDQRVAGVATGDQVTAAVARHDDIGPGPTVNVVPAAARHDPIGAGAAVEAVIAGAAAYDVTTSIPPQPVAAAAADE